MPRHLSRFELVQEEVRKRYGDLLSEGLERYTPIRIELDHDLLLSRVVLTSNMIRYVYGGQDLRGFLYIEGGYDRAYADVRGWQTRVPKFHVAECRTLEAMRLRGRYDGVYVFANQPTTMTDVDGQEKDLRVCLNCCAMVPGLGKGLTTTAFCEQVLRKHSTAVPVFQPQRLPKPDLLQTAYSGDDPPKVAAQRHARGYRCERCGLELRRHYVDGWYLETVYRNGNRQDLRPENLTFLCTLCNASTGASGHLVVNAGQRNKLMHFLTIYGEQLETVAHPLLERARTLLGAKR